MKLVRKIIRLLPLIFLLLVFLVLVNNDNIWVNVEGATLGDRVVNVLNVLDINSSGFWDGFIDSFIYQFYGPFSNLRDWFKNTFDINSYMFDMAFAICCYELWCSLMFLLFDVFGFIFNVAEAWLRKGDKLNE